MPTIRSLLIAVMGVVALLAAPVASAQNPLERLVSPGPLARAYEFWVRRLAEREGRGKSDPMLRAAEAAARLPVPVKARAKQQANKGAKKKSTKGRSKR